MDLLAGDPVTQNGTPAEKESSPSLGLQSSLLSTRLSSPKMSLIVYQKPQRSARNNRVTEQNKQPIPPQFTRGKMPYLLPKYLAETYNMECPICYRALFPSPVAFNCGHTLCFICFCSVNKCPVCRTKISSRVRNEYINDLPHSNPTITSNIGDHLVQLLERKFEKDETNLQSLKDRCRYMDNELLDDFLVTKDLGTLTLWLGKKFNLPRIGKMTCAMRKGQDMIFTPTSLFSLLFCFFLAVIYHSNPTICAAMVIPMILIVVVYAVVDANPSWFQ